MGDTKNRKVLGEWLRFSFILTSSGLLFVSLNIHSVVFAGLAWVNGMCKPAYSCTLNEGKSFEAAFVIAHEMGHRFAFFCLPTDSSLLTFRKTLSCLLFYLLIIMKSLFPA